MRMSQPWGAGGEGFRQWAQRGKGPEVGKSWGQMRSRSPPAGGGAWRSKEREERSQRQEGAGHPRPCELQQGLGTPFLSAREAPEEGE